jgi:tetratricopeptide (TPR) repeat protein
MSPMRTIRLAVTLAAIAACPSARASDHNGTPKLKTVLIPRKSSSKQDRASECLQKTPEFFLLDANRKIVPSAAGYLYLIERSDGNRVLLSDLSEGLRGWASARDVVALSEAESFFSGQIQANPKSAFALLMRGVARFENDDVDHAVADVDLALRLDPKYVPALIVRAYFWQWRNHLDRALADSSQAIEIDPRNSYAFIERAIFEYAMKQYDNSLRDFQAAIDLGSSAALIHVGRGMINLEKGDLKKAQAEFNKALEIDPRHPDAYCGYASMFLLRGDRRKALSILDQAVQNDPQSPESHGNRAIVLLSMSKYDKALDDLDDVLRFAPSSARAHRERAWLLATCPEDKIRNGEQAVASAFRACELTEWKEPHCLMTLAAACSEARDFDGAVKWQEKAVELLSDKNPEKPNYRKLLDRYKAKKPYHRLGLLEEIGLQSPRPAAKKGD